jgi:bacteriocin-like protein
MNAPNHEFSPISVEELSQVEGGNVGLNSLSYSVAVGIRGCVNLVVRAVETLKSTVTDPPDPWA